MIGQLINDRYKILDRIGLGGMAIVYKAEDTLLKRMVAVKVLKTEFSDDQEFLRKFKLEAQLAGSISHPNIVGIYDVGSQEINSEKRHYIIMEYVEGKTLKDIITSEGFLDNDRIAKYSRQIASALEEAHRKGLIHRDIKPSNILINLNDDVKVTDFGIARLVTGATMTYTTSILGTVHYISPEQAKGKPVGDKSDLYSLGVVMYEMACGRVPFDADNSVGIALKHIQEEAEDPRKENPNLAIGLYNIICKLLMKDPEDRFESSSKLKEALKNYKNFSLYDKDGVFNPDKTMSMKSVEEKKSLKPRKIAEYISKSDLDEGEPESKKSKFFLIALIIIALAGVAIAIVIDNNKKLEMERSKVDVPSFVNITEEQALELAKEKGLQAIVSERKHSDELEEGMVIDQSIAAGERVEKNTIIKLVVSQGQNLVKMVDVTGLTLKEATDELESKGFKIREVKTSNSDTVAQDYVISTNPEAGKMIKEGSEIVIEVSSGKKLIMPNLDNISIKDAEDQLLRMEIKVEKEYEHSQEVKENNIIRTEPLAGEELKKDDKVKLYVSKGKEFVEIPRLENLSYDDAVELLKKSELEVDSNPTYEYSDDIPKGYVIKSNPGYREEVKPGSKVSLILSKGEVVLVPYLENTTIDDAIRAIQDAKLKIGKIKRIYNDNVAKDRVISQSLKSNSQVEEYTAIDLVISLGKEQDKRDENHEED